ncbi:MAG: sulfatase modifying factor 1 [Verrucomicrobiales bacterium]|jgi:sulfatase modifying factor 1
MIRIWLCLAFAASPICAQEMIEIEAGRFLRGYDGRERQLNYAFPLMSTGQFYGNAEFPAHWTWISKSFLLSKSEVTVAQFRKFVEESDYQTTAEKSKSGIVGWAPTSVDKPLYQSFDFEQKPEFTWQNPGFEQTDDHPVVGVSWQDAQAFCAWLSKKENAVYRLPTEAEWELAARAGTSTHFSWGDEARNTIHRHANVGNVELERYRAHAAERHWLLDLETEPADPHVFTAPVASYEPNLFGLHDMGGNVWEWCQDYYLDTFYSHWKRPDQFSPDGIAADPINSSEPQTEANQFRVIRGGSWYTGPLQARPANRALYDEMDGAAYIGFRVLREIPDAKPDSRIAPELAAKLALEAIKARVYDRDQDKALEIEIPGENFDPAILQQLLALQPIDSLRLLNPIPVTADLLKAVARIDSLEVLDFGGEFQVQPADLAILTDLPNLKTLSFPRQFNATDEHLSFMSKLTTLEEISLFCVQGQLTDAGLRHLSGNRGLRSLKIHDSDVNGEFLADFEGAPLESVSIENKSGSETGLTDANAAKLGQFPTLREVYLRSPLIGGATIEALANLPQLQRLTLSGCTGLTDADCAKIGPASTLIYLRLTGTGAGDATAAAIAEFDQLGQVDLGSPALTDAGMERLSRIMSLQELNIERGSQITDVGVAELARLRRLRRCKLFSQEISGEGFAEFREITTLDDLLVASPALTDVAFDHFSRCDSLAKLRLVEADTQPAAALTNEGLFRLQRLKNLRELWLPREHTQMTEAKMEELKTLMAKCSVIPYTVRWKPD